jgi:hypothetical protein
MFSVLATRSDTKPPEQQTVVQNYGTFVHPEGEVRRSVLFRHPTTGERTMLNISDTHLSVAGIADLSKPELRSVVEVAPPTNEIYAFGSHVVERVDQGGYWPPNGVAEFRVKQAGGPIDDKAPVARFQIGQAGAVYRYKQSLVVMRQLVDQTGATGGSTVAHVRGHELELVRHRRRPHVRERLEPLLLVGISPGDGREPADVGVDVRPVDDLRHRGGQAHQPL